MRRINISVKLNSSKQITIKEFFENHKGKLAAYTGGSKCYLNDILFSSVDRIINLNNSECWTNGTDHEFCRLLEEGESVTLSNIT